MSKEQLQHYTDEQEQVAQAIRFLAPGDEKARLTKVCDNIHRLIMQAAVMQDDGKDISQSLDRIEKEFIKLNNS